MAKGVVTAQWGSITPLRRGLNGRFISIQQGTLLAVKNQAERIMDTSDSDIPRDTYALMDSRYVGEPQIVGDEVVIEFGYGGPNVQTNPKTGQLTSEYIIPVHERLDVYHPIGKAKFLEDAINEHAPELLEALGRDVRSFLNLGG